MVRERLAAFRREHLRDSILILGALGGLLALSGWSLGGTDGVVIALGLGALGLLLGQGAPELVLRTLGAYRVPRWMAPELVNLLELLARRAALPQRPLLFLVPSRSLQAFAIGDDTRPVVVVTLGLIETLSPREVAGVLGHEVSHLAARDTWLLRLGASVAMTIQVLSTTGLTLLLVLTPAYVAGEEPFPWIALGVLLFAPLASDLLWLWLSRVREFAADAGAVDLTGDPEGLASALYKLARIQGEFWEGFGRRPMPAWTRLLRTHPLTRARIQRLMALVPPQPPMIIVPARYQILQVPRPLL